MNEEISKPLDNLGGAAVRGEAVAEAAIDQLYGAVMNIQCDPERNLLKGQAADMSYKIGHRDARHAAADLIAAFSSSARAADAPSDLTNFPLTMAQVRAIRDTIKPGDGWDGDNWDFALANAVADKVKSRAADALDSQPTDLPPVSMSTYGTKEACEAEHARRAAMISAPLCRADGRCQYAIDSGAEGIGHCPDGKCCMPTASQVDALPWQIQSWLGDEWICAAGWDHGHTIPKYEFDTLPEALAALQVIAAHHNEHAFRVQPIARSQPTDLGRHIAEWDAAADFLERQTAISDEEKETMSICATVLRKVARTGICQADHQIASSQPTDGGVRNGRAALAKLLADAEPGDAT